MSQHSSRTYKEIDAEIFLRVEWEIPCERCWECRSTLFIDRNIFFCLLFIKQLRSFINHALSFHVKSEK